MKSKFSNGKAPKGSGLSNPTKGGKAKLGEVFGKKGTAQKFIVG